MPFRAIAATLSVLACALPLSGATITKANKTNDLTTALSWSGGVPPGAGDVAAGSTLVTGTNASAAAMRQHYRAALLTRKIDDEGYVTSNQHRGHAHDDERVVEDAVGVIVQAGVNRRLGRRAHRIDHEGVVEKHSRTRERIHVGRLQTGRAGRAVFC